MDADPANLRFMYFLTTNCKNNTTGSSLFIVPKVLPV
jgi:hypothetical protein